MRKTLVLLAALFGFALATPASLRAEPPSASGVVSGITVTGNSFYFWLRGVGEICPGQVSGKNVAVVMAPQVDTEEARRWMLSLLTIAAREGRTVRVYAQSNNPGWGCRVTALGMD
jgi:hypothetical protein